ncbi:hypothetical protein [Streptomyces fumanus]|uniref:C2H2-type domain-containing protein n=1 Tax=Streptomyces fumanus TaxID=67302 RepID=A0A919AGJ9_9ACTN|nr:hypothetical protein [Streptomyces fumanus]GHF04584.1 hypothetical protein GCM10018772_32260 [Streptomyces fumanus]
MSENPGQPGLRAGATAVVHESYSFACMRCGDGWEQSYEIEHHTDAQGRRFVVYLADGLVVPSPLSRPTCQNCDSHVVRIMRPGRVASARDAARPAPAARKPAPAGPVRAPVPAAERHHWHLADLLHALHLHRGTT